MIFSATSIDVVLGAHNIQQNEATQVRLTSTKYVAHEDWDSTRFVNDIAVIELPQEVELNGKNSHMRYERINLSEIHNNCRIHRRCPTANQGRCWKHIRWTTRNCHRLGKI